MITVKILKMNPATPIKIQRPINSTINNSFKTTKNKTPSTTIINNKINK